jgi:hypothetical protein
LGPLVNFGYADEVLLLVPISVAADARLSGRLRLKAEAEWLACEKICIPERAELSLELPVGGQAAARLGTVSVWAHASRSPDTFILRDARFAGPQDEGVGASRRRKAKPSHYPRPWPRDRGGPTC